MANEKRLEVALRFAERGCRIYPAQRAAKEPIEKGWRESATTDEGTIRGWWAKYRGCNFGMLTDDELVCLDIDRHADKDGLAELVELEGFGPLPPTHTDRTPSGGEHRIFRKPSGITVYKAKLQGYQALELLAKGASMILPGSFFLNGGEYKTVSSEFEFAELPKWLLELAQDGQKKDLEPTRPNQAKGAGAIPEGQRNVALTSLAGRLRRSDLVPAGILAALRATNEARCNPPLPDAEVAAIAESVSHYKAGDPAGEIPHEILPYPLTTLEQIYTAPPPEYGIEGLLHKNTLNLIDSPPKGGKTLFCLELAAAISQPDDFPFLGAFKVHWPPGSRVLIVDQENGATDLSSRLQGMKVPKEQPISFLHFAGVQLDKEESFARLLLTVQEVQPVLIIFDSLIRLHGVKEGSSDEIAPVMGRLRELVNAGFTVLVQHHQGWSAERSRGSTDIPAAVDFEYTLLKRGTEAEPYLVLSTPNPRRAPIEPIRLQISAEGGPVRMLYLGPDVVTKIDLDAEILRCVSEGEGRTFDEITAWMKDKGIRACESVLRKAVKGLVGSKVEETAGKHNRKIYSSLVVPN